MIPIYDYALQQMNMKSWHHSLCIKPSVAKCYFQDIQHDNWTDGDGPFCFLMSFVFYITDESGMTVDIIAQGKVSKTK